LSKNIELIFIARADVSHIVFKHWSLDLSRDLIAVSENTRPFLLLRLGSLHILIENCLLGSAHQALRGQGNSLVILSYSYQAFKIFNEAVLRAAESRRRTERISGKIAGTGHWNVILSTSLVRLSREIAHKVSTVKIKVVCLLALSAARMLATAVLLHLL